MVPPAKRARVPGGRTRKSMRTSPKSSNPSPLSLRFILPFVAGVRGFMQAFVAGVRGCNWETAQIMQLVYCVSFALRAGLPASRAAPSLRRLALRASS